VKAGNSGRVRLLRHRQSSASPALEIDVEFTRQASLLSLAYIVRGDIAAVLLPKQATPARADALWQHTCFEAFVGGAQSAGYWEFNLSPSQQWAAYRFDGCREGMAAEPAVADPRIAVQREHSVLRLSAAFDLSCVTALPASENWRVGLSAIIEDEDGDKSYWALAHAPGRPDFHHPDGFALCLPR
jgi:hypothetical protein